MRIKFLGFKVCTAGKITLTQLLEHLHGQPPSKYLGYDRIVRVGELEGYIAGLIVTVKDQRRFCAWQSKQLSLLVHELDRGTSMADFNFFLLNKKTLRGLYQHYHHAMGLATLEKFLNFEMREFAAKRSQAQIELAETEETVTSKKKALIRKQWRTNASVLPLVAPDNIEELVEELEQIRSLSLKVESLVPIQKAYEPLSGVVKSRRIIFTFNQEMGLKKIKTSVVQYLRSTDRSQGRIFGQDIEGRQRSINLDVAENYSMYGEDGYDEVAATMNFPLEDFLKAPMVKRLMGLTKKYKGLFDMPEAA